LVPWRRRIGSAFSMPGRMIYGTGQVEYWLPIPWMRFSIKKLKSTGTNSRTLEKQSPLCPRRSSIKTLCLCDRQRRFSRDQLQQLPTGRRRRAVGEILQISVAPTADPIGCAEVRSASVATAAVHGIHRILRGLPGRRTPGSVGVSPAGHQLERTLRQSFLPGTNYLYLLDSP
jgi:hypothetical protein